MKKEIINMKESKVGYKGEFCVRKGNDESIISKNAKEKRILY